MLGWFLRAGGYVALAAAFAFAVMDGARSLANGALSLTALGTTLARLSPQKYQAFAALVSHVSTLLWDPVSIVVLYVPTSLALALAGLALVVFGSPRRREL